MKNETVNLTPQEKILLALLTVGVFLTRLPWLNAGYGTDPDSYRVVSAARYIAQTGEYVQSRPPGYPAYEYLISLLPNTHAFFTNGLTTLFSCFGFLFFALILRYFNIKHYLTVAFAFALTPIVYVSSVSTSDYIVANAFVLAATYFTLQKQPVVSGMMLGLAIGCRITSGAMLLPLFLWMWLDTSTIQSRKNSISFAITALFIGGICFLPVLHQYGLNGFSFSEIRIYPSPFTLFMTGIVHVWGLIAFLGFLGLVSTLFFLPHKIKTSIREPLTRKGLWLCASVIVIYATAFLRLPEDAAYLIPAIPFCLLAIALLMPVYFLRYLTLFIVFSSLVSIDIVNNRKITSGPIFLDHIIRIVDNSIIEKTIKDSSTLPKNSVVVAAYNLPKLLLKLEDEGHQKNHPYIYMIATEAEYRHYENQGIEVYFMPMIDEYNMTTYGIDLRKLGAKPL